MQVMGTIGVEFRTWEELAGVASRMCMLERFVGVCNGEEQWSQRSAWRSEVLGAYRSTRCKARHSHDCARAGCTSGSARIVVCGRRLPGQSVSSADGDMRT